MKTAFVRIVLAWTDRSGLRATGRQVLKDLNWFPEFEPCIKAHAAMWLNKGKLSDVEKAQAHLDSMDKEYLARRVFVYPLSEKDPLGRARREILEEKK